MTNLNSMLKSRDITLPKMVHLVKAMVFLVVTYGCESWTLKKAEHQKIDAFELWCPLDWKEIQPVHPKGVQYWVFIGRTAAKAKHQYSGYRMWRIDSLEKTLMLGNIESGRRRDDRGWRWLDGITDLMDMSLSKLQEMAKDREGWCAAIHGIKKRWTRLNDCTIQPSSWSNSHIHIWLLKKS